MEAEALERVSLEGKKTLPNGITKPITAQSLLDNFQNTTELDLSGKNIRQLEENLDLPPCLRIINLSHNKLDEVPKPVLQLENLKVLDVSHNNIEIFNDRPSFCHAIEYLNLSQNGLKVPPLWVWSESPRNLSKLDISCNLRISDSLTSNFDEILQYNALVTHVKLYNCRLGKLLRFLGTFSKVLELELGTPDWSCYAANHLQEVPCQGLDKCCDIQRLNLSNTHIYTITPKINMFKNLKEINLSHNNLNGVPNEFCELENLEICILSYNNILYLPDNIVKLTKLTTLCLDVNELCMIPQNIMDLVNLTTLDLYDNNICEVPEGIKNIPEIDLAQNYMEEPKDQNYLDKRDRLRGSKVDRQNGRKYEIEKPDSEHSSDTTDDEEFMQSLIDAQNRDDETTNRPLSSPEDWDSDSHWEPHCANYTLPTHSTHWLAYVKKKMKDGNLCPMDSHTVSIAEKVKYEKLCYPVEVYESDGQFDDLSEDDS